MKYLIVMLAVLLSGCDQISNLVEPEPKLLDTLVVTYHSFGHTGDTGLVVDEADRVRHEIDAFKLKCEVSGGYVWAGPTTHHERYTLFARKCMDQPNPTYESLSY